MYQFARRLKELRLSHKMTQQALAEKLGIAKSTVSMYENGKRQPDFETLEAIADLFNVSLGSLMEEKDSKPEPAAPTTLAAHFEGQEFTQEEIEEIKRYADYIRVRNQSETNK